MGSDSETPDSSVGNGYIRKAGILPHDGNFDVLRRYIRAKLEIASQLRNLLVDLKKYGDQTSAESCGELMEKLAEDRFTVVLLGQSKRGKSTLINAIVGGNVLPTGTLSLRSIAPVVRFGSRERLAIRRTGSQFPQYEPIAAVAEYITEERNPANQKAVETVALELTLPFLRRGIQLVDTPGIFSAMEASPEQTRSFLASCDAILFVTGADNPLSETELELVSAIRCYAQKIIFVLNKVDLLPDESEADQLVKSVNTLLSRELYVTEIKITPVSAMKALEAALSRSAAQFVDSGLPELENILAHLLVSRRQAGFLHAIVNEARSVVARELDDIELENQAIQIAKPRRDDLIRNITADLKQLDTERLEILQEIRDQVRKCVFAQAGQNLAKDLSKECEAASRRLASFVRAGGVHSTGSIAELCSREIAPRFRAQMLRWFNQNAEWLAQSINTVMADGLGRLRANIAGVTAVPRKAFGLSKAGAWEVSDKFSDLPFQLNPGIDLREEWNPHIPRCLRFLPTVTVKRWLREHLKRGLIKFTDDQQTALLNIIWRQLEDTLGAVSDQAAKQTGNLERHVTRVLTAEPDPLENKLRIDSIASYRDRLLAIRNNLTFNTADFIASTGADFAASHQFPASLAGTDFTRPVKAYNGGDFSTRGCPVCDRLENLSKEFIVRLQYALYHNDQVQESFTANGGLCPLHTWQLEALSAPDAFSVGYAKLVGHIGRVLAKEASSPESANANIDRLCTDSKRCRICVLLREAEQREIKVLASTLHATAGKERYVRSQGVCLRHLGMLLKETSDAETIRFLLETAASVFELISEDMEAFALKREAARRQLVSDDEADAYLRALIHVVGAKFNYMP
jgi:ribosome biogenesis GTPase A